MMIIMTTMMMLFWDLHTAADDGDGGGGDGDDDDYDNDNNDNYDDDDDAFVGFTHYTCSTRSPVNGQNFDRRLLSTILDSGTRPYMPGKRATSRVERAIMLLTALKPDRMGAERAGLLIKEQRYPFVLSQISQISCVLHHQLNGKNPSRYLCGPRLLKGTALRAGPRWLHTPQLNGGPARRAVKNTRASCIGPAIPYNRA